MGRERVRERVYCSPSCIPTAAHSPCGSEGTSPGSSYPSAWSTHLRPWFAVDRRSRRLHTSSPPPGWCRLEALWLKKKYIYIHIPVYKTIFIQMFSFFVQNTILMALWMKREFLFPQKTVIITLGETGLVNWCILFYSKTQSYSCIVETVYLSRYFSSKLVNHSAPWVKQHIYVYILILNTSILLKVLSMK